MSAEALSPTTGEPVAVVASRNRVGLYLLIVADAAGTIALLISYVYLWSLNVNNGWAPNTTSFGSNNVVTGRAPLPWAADWLFWAILVVTIVATLFMWWGARGIRAGHHARLMTGAALATLVIVLACAMQIWQMCTFPFQPDNGSYASAVYLLTGSAAVHLFLLLFLTLAVVNRSRAGLISADNPSQASLVAVYMTWICTSLLLACLCTTFMKDSSNPNPAPFGELTQPGSAVPNP